MKERRKILRLNQEELAQKVGVARQTVSSWERGDFAPDSDNLMNLASAMQTSVAYLLGERDDATRSSGTILVAEPEDGNLQMIESNASHIDTRPEGWRQIPLYSHMRSVCGGQGNGLEIADFEIESVQYFPAEIYGKWDDENPPFMKYVDGDSMEPAGIMDGAVVLVNPAETVHDGESALVCWGDDVQAVKLVYWLPNGIVEFRAANPAHPKVYRFTMKDIDTGRAGILGKIMWSGQKPKRMK